LEQLNELCSFLKNLVDSPDGMGTKVPSSELLVPLEQLNEQSSFLV
jgi:hypothetical protein